MESSKIAFERIDGYEQVIRIPLANIQDSKFVFEVLKDTFDECFQNGESRFVVDLENVHLPSSSLIALLIEATSRARRLGGDIKILNLSTKTLAHFSTFSPKNYLSIEDNESTALQDFPEEAPLANNSTAPLKSDVSAAAPADNPATPLAPAEPDEAATPPEPATPAEPVTAKTDLDVADGIPIPGVDIVDDPLIEKLHDEFSPQPEPGSQTKRVSDNMVAETQKGERNHLRVKSATNNLYTICDFVTNYAERAGLDVKEVGKMKIAVYEACLNVIEHAYHSNPDNWIDVWIEYNIEMFKIIIQDYGTGFDGFSNKKYDVVSAMDDRKTGGFGLYIIRRSMDELDYRPDPRRGNRLTMIKFIK